MHRTTMATLSWMTLLTFAGAVLLAPPAAATQTSCTVTVQGGSCSFECDTTEIIEVVAHNPTGTAIATGSCSDVTVYCVHALDCDMRATSTPSSAATGTCTLNQGTSATCRPYSAP
jgi:ABC-type tungstate transport system permease subunit